jgi:hypothetical protein
LEGKLRQYFPSLNVNEYDWVGNPLAVTTADTKRTKHVSLKDAEELAGRQADRTIQLKLGKHYNSGIWQKEVLSVIRLPARRYVPCIIHKPQTP